MKYVGIIFVGLLLLLNSCMSVKEYESDLTVLELEERMEKAMDPSGEFAKAETFYQIQTLKIDKLFGNSIYEIRMSYMKPHYLRVSTYQHNKRISSVIFNGESAWTVDYKKKTVEPITGNEFVRLKTFYDIASPSAKYHELFNCITLTKCEVNDNTYYKMVCKVDEDSENVLTVYVDSESFLTRKLDLDFSIMYEGKKKDMNIVNYIEAYDSSNDVMFPIEISSNTNGIKSTTSAYLYKLNTPIDLTKFQPPIFPYDNEKRQLHRMKTLEKN